ncbi:general transcription factor IIH subunit 2 isoform X2 [Orussus abietinus]|uniref:general transcription factor IIH subunit 2 isoform X2 n=1 Tax=Orussus abietinus TaxID=222816 RepID=UPI0006255D59|nr:general transcription factor IIH subunit 2 isoform X2 [Orussus abietinus]
MADEDDKKEYRWETGYEKTWEAIKEDDNGFLNESIEEYTRTIRKRLQLDKNVGARLGMMRHLYVILDCSESMMNQDLKPTRLLCSLKLLENFIEEFFYQNPISQMGIITTRNKRAEKLSELSGNPKKHIQEMKALDKLSLTGEPSLQNSIELALKSLKLLPPHASREVLIIMGSLTTCDPGDINATIERMASITGGDYSVVLDDKHYKDQLSTHIDPPPAATRLDAALIRMGFPHHALHLSATDSSMSLCMCHAGTTEMSMKLMSTGYLCPQCLSKHCELPVECRACGLTLVSAPHLARSYHYLFPIEHFQKVVDSVPLHRCYGCQKQSEQLNKKMYICNKCKQVFCMECEIFIHESLHTCPGCATNPETYHRSQDCIQSTN